MFDPYYETKVNQRWARSSIGTLLGPLFIVLGFMALAFTIIDLAEGMSPINGSGWQENSIWPTIGKGIWVAAILITTGVVGMIANKERTQVSLYVFNAFSWVSAVFSLYLLASSILHVHPYMVQNMSTSDSRTTPMNIEIIFNSLLMMTGGLAFIVSLASAILTCLAGNCCVNHRRYTPLNMPYGPTHILPYGQHNGHGIQHFLPTPDQVLQ